MTRERRYREEEIREIFRQASRESDGGPPAVADARGLTLAELQEIGREVGMDPTAVTRAAAEVELRPPGTARRSYLGMPLQVGRIIPLPRAPTDVEWERLVGELRTTFGARGRVSSQGGLREWSNGNLHACVEPAETGYRLRLATFKGDAQALNAAGITGVVTGAIAFGALFLSGGGVEGVFVPWMISASGVGALLANWLRLPRWAREREEQMGYLAARAGAIVGDDPPAGEPEA